MDLSVKYMGITLKNPIVIGSSGLTSSVHKIEELAKKGVGAVVVKSLFEEQILKEGYMANDASIFEYPGSYDYVQAYSVENAISEYLSLLQDAKKNVDIPVIASINCVTSGEWVNFVKKIENTGVDGIEINVSILPTDIDKSCQDYEAIYFDILAELKGNVSLPIALKMSQYSSGLANLINRLSWTKQVDNFVLFNRYYQPDIDTEKMIVENGETFSRTADLSNTLRWLAIISSQIEVPLTASTGMHSGNDIVKALLAGANVVQIVSSVYQNGTGVVGEMLHQLEAWMQAHHFDSIADFRGKLSNSNEEINSFNRIQFMKYFSEIG
jgi:dihydroorotate dehydrogenase (fumarate)